MITLYAARNLCMYKKKQHKYKLGRKFKITKIEWLRMKLFISNIINEGQRLTSTKLISTCDLNVSRWIVQRHLRKAQFKYSKARQVISLLLRHKKARIEMISEWISTNHCWEKTVFTDEKLFSMDGQANWSSYSRNFWNDRDKFFNEVAKFVSQ